MDREKMTALMRWKEDPGRKPLIIRGARQVGKTWLMRAFGEIAFEDTAYFNFDENKDLAHIFADNISPDYLIEQLEIVSRKKIHLEKTLLIFDEIQEAPRALTSLKYFNENAPGYPIIAAGSLLGIALHPGTSFPVGKVSFLDLFPVTFSEFLRATGKDHLYKVISSQDHLKSGLLKTELGDSLKKYFLIGGMPKAVDDYINNRDFERVYQVQDEIISAYDQDISKHAPQNHVPRIRHLWESIPPQLAKERKKFFYSQIRDGARSKDYELALMWLSDCGLIHRVNRLSSIEYPIKAYEDARAFKVYLCDVGLLSRLSGLTADVLLQGGGIYNEFKGALSEQYVCQELTAAGWVPFYWSNERGQAEVDFVVQSGADILPIEVKSGINLKAKSLKTYMEKYRPKTAIRTSPADMKISAVNYEDGTEAELIDLPLYGFSEELARRFERK